MIDTLKLKPNLILTINYMQLLRTGKYLDIQEDGGQIERFNLTRWADVQALMERNKIAVEIAIQNPWKLIDGNTMEIID